MSVVTTIEGRCRKCYSCVRHCPAKAIKVENEQAKVLPERCISCGYCVTVCSQKAKYVERDLYKVRQWLNSGEYPVVALIAPSFVAQWYEVSPGQVSAALRTLGFDAVFEVAYGAEVVTREYGLLLSENVAQGIYGGHGSYVGRDEYEGRGHGGRGFISTPCPAIINLVEKHYPELIPWLAPVVSPMVAAGRAARVLLASSLGPTLRTVFIGPCVAKKEEASDPEVSDAVDAVLTFRELRDLIREEKIILRDLGPEGFDNPPIGLGRIYPVSGGLLRTASVYADILKNEIVTVEGRDRCLEFIRALAAGHIDYAFVDMLFCEGCISGPMLENDASIHMRRKKVVQWTKERFPETFETPVEAGFLRDIRGLAQAPPGVRLRRGFTDRSVRLPIPSEDEIKETLRVLDKTSPEDELNCGACGYDTCRDKAIAVCQGLAENRMCLPWLITQLERNNAELTYLKDYNRSIVESVGEAIIVVDKDGYVTTLHDPKGIFNKPDGRHHRQEGAVRQHVFAVMPHLDQERIRKALQRVMERGEPVVFEDLRYAGERGSLILNLKGYPLRGAGGAIEGTVLICEDVTAERRLLSKLAESEKLASVGRLAAGVAHEINNPLGLISGYVELLKAKPGLDDSGEEALKIVSEEVDRIARIVKNLLAFARPPAPGVETCNVNEVLKRLFALLARQMHLGGITLKTELENDLPDVRAPGGEVEQVFLNMMMNAIEAMPDGGTLRVISRMHRGNGKGVNDKNGKSVEVIFCDSGVGIPEENLGRIFDPFFTTKEVGKGSGLGLSVSYGIVKKYGGSIGVSSRVGEGSTFTVCLPADRGGGEEDG
ncbi:MAG TPA: PAS domain-containing protein [Clostridia bacterium]|nr:PAS domain-containing protein [Clostridia bacterium]